MFYSRIINLEIKKEQYKKKRKEQYRDSYFEKTYHPKNSYSDSRVIEYEKFPNMRSHTFKKFSTQQERGFFLMHEIEYANEYGLKLRRRRSSANLPNSWDDIHSSVYEKQTSWKTSTNRRNQYYK